MGDEEHPCLRLADSPTLNTIIRYKIAERKVDSLDLSLSAKYNHHTQWCADKASTLRQHFALDDGVYALDGHRWKNLLKARSRSEDRESYLLPIILQQLPRDSINHLQNSLGSSHLPSTVRGYGKKPN